MEAELDQAAREKALQKWVDMVNHRLQIWQETCVVFTGASRSVEELCPFKPEQRKQYWLKDPAAKNYARAVAVMALVYSEQTR